MKKNGVYFKKQAESVADPENKNEDLRRKGIFTALVYIAITLAAIVIFVVVRSNGEHNLVALLLALAIAVTCVEVYWSNPDKKAYVLWKKLFNKD
ncbi:MAG: hypothetical protein J6U10_05845 [Lachnospiraceae bacterium]|nr:hypothetical protein [Lachnospiraceae bacterium]MBP5185268.1 hypothetical protein [Lachnospiraceae bacterium]